MREKALAKSHHGAIDDGTLTIVAGILMANSK